MPDFRGRGGWRQRGRSALYGALYGGALSPNDPSLDDPLTAAIGGALRGTVGALEYRDQKKAERDAQFEEWRSARIKQQEAEAEARRLEIAERRTAAAETRAQETHNMRRAEFEAEQAGRGVRSRGEVDAMGAGAGRDFAFDVGQALQQPGGRFAPMSDGSLVDRYQTPDAVQHRSEVIETRGKQSEARAEAETRAELYRRVQGGDRDAEAEMFGAGVTASQIAGIRPKPKGAEAAPAPRLTPTQTRQRVDQLMEERIARMTPDDQGKLNASDLANMVLSEPSLWEGVEPKQGMPELMRLVRAEAIRAASSARAKVLQDRAKQANRPSRPVSNR